MQDTIDQACPRIDTVGAEKDCFRLETNWVIDTPAGAQERRCDAAPGIG
jgi:hypothetical protein